MTDWRAIAEMLWNLLPDHGVPEDCRPDPEDCRYCAGFRAYRAALSADDPPRCTGCIVLEDDDGTLKHAVVVGCPVHDVSVSSNSADGGRDG